MKIKYPIFALLSCGFLLFSLAPTVYELSQRNKLPEVRAFELIHNFPTDYNFYLSRIREGIEGKLTVVEKYTSEPHQGSLIHEFYLILGWVGRWVRVPWERAGDVYQVARIVFGMTLLLFIAEFAKRSFPDALRGQVFSAHPSNRLESKQDVTVRGNDRERSYTASFFSKLRVTVLEKTRRAATWFTSIEFWQILAFLLAVTAGTWPKLVAVDGTWRLGGYMPWWSVMDSLQRITFIPHLLAGQALILFLIMSVADERVMKRSGNWIFLGILAFILGMILPPGLIMVYAAVGFLTMIEAMREIGVMRADWGKLVNLVIPKFIVCLPGLPALLYLQLMTSFYPWKRLTEFDILHPLPFDYAEYIKAMGPVLPLGLLGLLIAVKSREKIMDAAAAWVLGWATLLIVFRFVPSQSPLRFSEMIPHVPLAILAIYLFFVVCKRLDSGQNFLAPLLARIFSNQSGSHSLSDVNNSVSIAKLGKRSAKILSLTQRFLQLSLLTLLLLLVLLGLGVMWSSFFWQRDFVDHKAGASYPLVPTGSYVMYPLKDWLAGMKFLQDATGRDTVILSETTAGNYLPVYSGNAVYVGHANTVKAEEKGSRVTGFYGGQMLPEDARAWLDNNNLHYVFYGPQEREDGGGEDLSGAYPFLKKIFENPYVIIYQY